MPGGDDDAEESQSTADSESTPSLSSLAGRIRGDEDPPDEGSEDESTTVDSSDDASPIGLDGHGDADFFFPGEKHPGKADTDGETRSSAEEQADTTARDNTAVPGSDNERGAGRPENAADGRASRFSGDAKVEAIIELVGDMNNLLLLGPILEPADHGLCANLLVPGEDVPDHLLLVTFDQSPDERVNVLRDHLESLSDDVAILNVGDATRSPPPGTVNRTNESGEINVTSVPDPTDIQRIGLRINKYLSEWADEDEVMLCFHSLTSLLRAVESETVFRFLNILLGRVRSGDVRAHYHMDPDEHDDQTLETYRSLFDEVLRFEDDGTVRIDR